VAKDHGAKQHFFGQLLGLALDHQHRGLGARHHQIELAVGALGLAGVEQIFTVDVADPGRTDGAVEGDAADRQGGAGGDQGRDVGIDLGVERERVHHHLHFVEEAFGKERANGAVDQAAGEGLELARTAFALEEAARDFARSIGFFQVIDGEREKVLPGLGVGFGDHGGQHHCAVHVEQHGAAGLARDLAGFEAHGVAAPLEAFADFVKQTHECS